MSVWKTIKKNLVVNKKNNKKPTNKKKPQKKDNKPKPKSNKPAASKPKSTGGSNKPSNNKPKTTTNRPQSSPTRKTSSGAITAAKSKSNERRTGATLARENKWNKAREGATQYIIRDKAEAAATAPTRLVSGTLKNSQDRAGEGRGRRGGMVKSTDKNGKSTYTRPASTTKNSKLTDKQKAAKSTAATAEDQRNARIKANQDKHKKGGYDYGDNVIKAADKRTKSISKKFEGGKEKALEYGASGLSDTKHDVPIYTKYAKGKARDEAKTQLKKEGITQKAGKAAVDDWIKQQEKEYGLKDDTVLADGRTWKEYKNEAYNEQSKAIKDARKDYINSATKDAGKMSAQDIYKATVPMASEMIDYAIPYAGTAKGSIKLAEKIVSKAAKAGAKASTKAGVSAAKSAPKIEKSIGKLVKDGKLTPKAAEKLNRRIKLKSGVKSVSKELLANAMQDASIGTALDLGKGISEGYEKKDLQKYMRDNAIANLALGVPMSAVAGRAGAKEARTALAEATAKQVNDLTKLTRAEGMELGALMQKSEQGIIGAKETERLAKLQDKALGGNSATVNNKGDLVVNNSETTLEGLTRQDAKDYIRLKAKSASGTLQTNEIGRLADLQGKVESAYKQTETTAEKAINISGRKIKSADQGDLELAVRFYERTGNTTKLKQAEKSLDIAKKATAKRNEDLSKAVEIMSDKTGIPYRWVDDAEMRAIVGDELQADEFAKGFYHVDENGNAQILINRESPQAHQTVIGHETCHLIKSSNEKAFNELGDLLRDFSSQRGEFEALERQMKQAYPELKGADFDEEVTSELLGRYIFGEDDKFIRRLAGEQPTTLEKIVDYIKAFIAKTQNKELAEQLVGIQKKAEKAIEDIKPEAVAKSVDEKKLSKIGERSGNLTKEQTNNLGIAKKLNRNGVDQDTIKRTTKGWFFGKDGLPRLEISDSNARVNVNLATRGFNGKDSVPLKDVLVHDTIYKHYRDAEKIKVVLDNNLPNNVYGRFVNDEIHLNPKIKDEKTLRATLLHELQHYIQKEEGFIRGSSVERWENVRTEIDDELETYFDALNNTSGKLSRNDISSIKGTSSEQVNKILTDKIRLHVGEQEAREFASLIDDATEMGYDAYVRMIGGDAWHEFQGIDSVNYSRTGGEAEANDTVDKMETTQADIDAANAPDYSKESILLDPARFTKYEDEFNRKRMKKNGGVSNYDNRSNSRNGSVQRSDESEPRQGRSGAGNVSLYRRSAYSADNQGIRGEGKKTGGEIKHSKEKKPTEVGSFNTKNLDQYKDAKTYDEFVDKNFDLLKKNVDSFGETKYGGDEMEEVWRMKRSETLKSSAKELSEEDAADIIRDGIKSSHLAGWFRNGDSGYKPRIAEQILGSDDVLNAGWNVMYKHYKELTGSTVSFDDFLDSTITLYRGERGQSKVSDDIFNAYSFDRKMAEEHADGNQNMIDTLEIKPSDTWGSYQTTVEAEVLVPEYHLANAKFSKEKITAETITDSTGNITKETDDAYLKAVESGDEEVQKKIIEATADHKLKDSKLRDENGDLIPMYHSTIGGKFTVFDKNRADPEGNSGAGFYFSSSKSDSNNNYATVEGADVSAKIERRAEELADEYDADPDGFIERYGKDIDDVDDIDFDDLAEKDLFVSSEEYNTYLDVKEPLYVGSNGTNRETDMLERLEARVDDNHESTTYREDYDDEIDFEEDRDTERYMFTDEEIGSLADEVADDLNLQYGDYQRTVRDIASAINECYEDGRMTFDDLKEALWNQSEGFYGEEGENLVNEIARSVAEKLGYDGIVDYKVSTKFRGMGLKDGDFHTIVFKPEQIKTTEAITRDDAGNVIPPSERFNTSNQDMRFSKIKKVVSIDGNEYENVIKLDTNEFDGVTKSQRATRFRNFVYDNLAGEKFTAYDFDGNPHTIEFAKADDTHKKIGAKRPQKTLNEIALKPSYRPRDKQTQDAIAQADEIIEVSRLDHGASDNRHGWLDKNGWEYRELIIADRSNALRRCQLDIAKTEDGRAVLYEVKVGKKIGQVDEAATNGLPVNSNLSDGIIPQNAPNGKFSKERKADGSKLSDLEARLKRVDDQLKKTGNKDRRAALQAEKSELEGYIEQERAKNVENSNDSWYTNSRGDANGQETKSATRGTENIRGTSEEVRGNGRSEGRTEANPSDGGTGDSSVSTERLGGNVLTKEHKDALAKSGVKVGRVVDRSSEPEAFIEQLKANANSQKFGVAVDSDLKAEDLKGAKLYTASMGNVTIGIKPDGDIFALAKNTASRDPKAFNDAMFSAIANGGVKMDNYGIALTNKYERFGFEPVAKIPFNPAYISDEAMPAFQEMIDRGIQPDVYVMKHNGDSLEEVGRKFANDEYKISTQKDLDKLPVYEGYDEALKYRDSLIENERAEKQWREENPQSAKMVDDEYVSDKVKTALKDIREANIYTSEAEKLAKQYNSSGRKIAALKKKIENSKTPEHIRQYEEELAELELKQKNLAGEIEQKGKMKAVDPNMTAKEQLADIRGSREVKKVNKEPQALVKENGRIKDAWTSLRRLFEDSFIAMETEAKRVMKDNKELGQRLLTQINRVRNDKNVFTEWITTRRSTFDNHLSGKALDDIFTPELRKNTEKYNDFQDYLLMKHVPARHEKGTDIWADVSPELAEKRVKELEDQYGDEIKDWAKEVYDYLDDLQQYRVDSGILTKEAMEQFKEDYPFYVPTNRVHDSEPVFFTKGNINNGVRTAKGGESEVMDIYDQLYTATNKTIHAAEENQMLNLYFKARGISEETLKGAELKDLEHAAIKAEVNNATNKATVSFFVDGKPVRRAVDHQVARGLREWDGLEFEKMMKAAKVATLYGRPFKALITDWNVVFGVRNGARDFQQALVNSKNTRYFTSSIPSAYYAIIKKNNAYMKLYESMGGKYAQLVSFDDAGKPINIEKGAVDKILGGMDKFTDLKYNPIRLIEQFNGGIELIPRLSEFIGTIRKDANDVLKKQGSSIKKLKEEITKEVETLAKDGEFKGDVTDEIERRLSNAIVDLVGKDTIDAAMRNANDITLNFGRSGVIGKALNMGFVPYFNPSIQGLSKLVRMFTENGIEGGGKALLNLGMKLSLITLAPAAANEWFLRDNEDYQNLNSRDKDNNFFIPWGDDGMFIKIPKPRENAVLAEPVEYGLRHFLDNAEYAYFDWSKLSLDTGNLFDKIPLTEEGKQSFRTAMDNIGIINPMDSNMVSPLWQTIHNKTWYGGSIESAYDMEKKSNKRYDLTTSAVAIQLGQTAPAKFFNLSPKKIDNLLDSYTGMIYDLGISQTSEKAKSEGNWFTRTIASQFMKDSVFSNKLSTKAWAKVDGMSEEQQKKYKSTYMYDTFKYDDAMNLVTTDKSLTKAERAAIKRDLMRHKNMLNREAIDGSENTVEPLSIIAKHLGANRTLNNFLPDVGDSKYKTWKDYYKAFKNAEGFKGMPAAKKERLAKKFLDVYSLGVQGQKKIDPAGYHDMPSWGMTGVAAAQLAKQNKLTTKEAKSIMMACDVYESQTETYFKYSKYGGNVNRFAVTQKNIEKTLGDVDKWGIDTGTGLWQSKYDKAKGVKGGVYSMSLATGKADFKDRAYYIANSGDPNMLIKMNAARGYSERYGHSTKGLVKLAKKADKDGNTYLKDDEIAAACNTIKKGKATSEEKAMAFVLLGGNPNKNPFGSIGDYSHKGDTGIQMDGEQKSSGGRRGHGHGGWGHGGGGGSSKGTPPKTESGAFKGKVTDPFATSNGTKASNLNDAYRKRLRKLNKIS